MTGQYYDYVRGKQVKKIDCERARELYDEGLCDSEIATGCGVSRNSVTNWRKREGLPRNKPPKKKPEKKPEKRRRAKSQLSIDAAEARKLGMNYGMYKALQFEAQRNLKAERALEKLQRRMSF